MFVLKDKYELSLISISHYQKLISRSLLLLLGAAIYIYGIATNQIDEVLHSPVTSIVLIFMAIFFCIEMISRLVPSPLESMGCEKQFARNLKRTDVPEPMLQSWQKTAMVVISWLTLNGAIGAIYLSGVASPYLNEGFMYMLCLAYAVCDMICILFFCPFQTWMMKNKCCGTCRIYNWDYAMMFTPLVFIPSIPTYIVLGFAMLVLVVWEYRFRKHPERFSEATNANLSCANCPEKLCRHKTQLSAYIAENREELHKRGELLSEKLRKEIATRQNLAKESFEATKSNLEKTINETTVNMKNKTSKAYKGKHIKEENATDKDPNTPDEKDSESNTGEKESNEND